MALFNKIKKNTKSEKPKAEKAIVSVAPALTSSSSSAVLTHPRITEKATMQSENSVYVFNVSDKANKKDVMRAVKDLYKVEPIKVNITKTPAKRVFIRGKSGKKSGFKKAYVYLKKGETIEFV